MKKLAKLAALLAAGALAFGFAACSGDDDNDPPMWPPEVTATLAAESNSPVELVAGVTDGTPVSATLTLANDVFSEAVTSADDLDGLIEADAGENAEVISVTLEEQLTEANVAKIVIEIAAAEGAVVGDSGTITVRVTGAVLANTSEAVTAEGGIAYTVVNLPEGPHPVTDVSVTPQTASIKVGEEKQLTANVVPVYADNKKVTWSSDNEGVATVDATTGNVKGVAKGKAKITANTDDGGFTDSCTVSVTETMPSGGTPHKDVKIDVSDLSSFADGAALSDEANIKAVGALTVDSNTKKSTFAGEEISPSKRLKLDSTISSKGLEVNLTGDATILVYAYSSTSGAARSLALYDADKQIIGGTTQGIGTGDDNKLNVAVFKVKANTTYYIGAVDSGINIYYIAVLGTFTEEASETVEAKAATCTEAGNPVYTLTDYGRYILADGTAVPSSGIMTAALGHDYTGVTPKQVTLPTENTEGKFTAACARNCGHTQDIVLPELTDPSYTRKEGSNGNYSYSYVDRTTGLTVTFETTKVEQGAEKVKYLIGFDSAIQDKNNYGVEGWAVSSQNYKAFSGVVIDDIAYAKGAKLNSTGYIDIVINAEAKVTFYISHNIPLAYAVKTGIDAPAENTYTTSDASTAYGDVYKVVATLAEGNYRVKRGDSTEIALYCMVIEPADQ